MFGIIHERPALGKEPYDDVSVRCGPLSSNNGPEWIDIFIRFLSKGKVLNEQYPTNKD